MSADKSMSLFAANSGPNVRRTTFVVSRRMVGLFATLVLVPFLAGCPPAVETPAPDGATGTGGTGGAPPVGCAEAPMMLVQTCGGSQCHNPGVDPPGLDLVTLAGLETRLIGKTAHTACPTGESVLVNPARPAAGVLFVRVGGNTCFKQMPPLDSPNPPAPPNFVECLRSWMESKLP